MKQKKSFRVAGFVRQFDFERKVYRALIILMEKWNPFKFLITAYVLLKSILLRYLFGITKLSSYLTFLDKDCTKLVLRLFGAKIGAECDIESHILIHNARSDFRNLIIGNGCHIGKDTFFDIRAPIIIGDFVTISMRTTITTHISVGQSSLNNRYPRESAPVRINNNVYIGANSTILKGITIGEGSFVAACSLVQQDVPGHTVVGGIPAKTLKYLKERENDSGI